MFREPLVLGIVLLGHKAVRPVLYRSARVVQRWLYLQVLVHQRLGVLLEHDLVEEYVILVRRLLPEVWLDSLLVRTTLSSRDCRSPNTCLLCLGLIQQVQRSLGQKPVPHRLVLPVVVVDGVHRPLARQLQLHRTFVRLIQVELDLRNSILNRHFISRSLLLVDDLRMRLLNQGSRALCDDASCLLSVIEIRARLHEERLPSRRLLPVAILKYR